MKFKIICYLLIFFSFLISQNWTIKIQAEINLWGMNNYSTDEENYLGVDENALDEYDILDVPEPPHVPSNYITLYFPHPEWESNFSSNFTQDIKFNSNNLFNEEGKLWFAEIYSDAAGDVLITTEPSSDFPNCQYSIIVDNEEYLNQQNIDFYINPYDIKEIEIKVYNCEELKIDNVFIENELNLQIYPNPFNNKSIIEYNLFKTEKVDINIYDIKGKKVLLNNQQNRLSPAGKNSYQLNFKETKSGIYFLTIKTDQTVTTKKFTVIK